MWPGQILSQQNCRNMGYICVDIIRMQILGCQLYQCIYCFHPSHDTVLAKPLGGEYRR